MSSQFVPSEGDPTGAGGHAADRTFLVDGLCCGVEARRLEERVGALPGVAGLSVDMVNRRLAVRGEVSSVAIEQVLRDLGLASRLPAGAGPARDDLGAGVAASARDVPWWRSPRFLLTTLAGALLGAGLVLDWGFGLERAAAVVLVLSFVAGDWLVAPRAWRAVRARALDMNVLTTVAGLGAIAIGEYAEAAAILFLFAVAQLLEARSMDRVRRAIGALMEYSPAEATVLRHGHEARIAASAVAVGDHVLVRPGERVPVDGVVLAGESEVDQAPITGESKPVSKSPGGEVFAGTVNGLGALEVEATREPQDTTLARIIHTVERAQANRAPFQTFVDRFARIYTPAVLALSALVFLFPPLLGLGGWSEWSYRALVLLVIACPCALVISTPVTVVSGLAGAARRGILVKGGAHLERLGRLDTVALDKTGTVTNGEPAVSDVVALDGVALDELLRLAASAEARSEHPLARALVARAAEAGVRVTAPAELEALPGRGVRSLVDGREVHVGGERLFRELGRWSPAAASAAAELESRGRTAVAVGTEAGVLGVIGLTDSVRPEAPAAVAALRRLGARRIALLTGDNEAVARNAAEAMGVDSVKARLLPEEKVAAVRDLMRDGPVLFVGDGVNDAPALATSTVGVAMGAAGTDVALETADVALMGDDLSRLPVAVRIGRKVNAIVRQNVTFAIASKLLFAVLAMGGFATLWMAVAADMGASLAVIFNGLRAVRVKDDGGVPLKPRHDRRGRGRLPVAAPVIAVQRCQCCSS